ncbi:MAG: 3-oxoacyl-[acyl-carrier-protein] synthase III, partial [uncultured Ramlibacter sp.]
CCPTAPARCCCHPRPRRRMRSACACASSTSARSPATTRSACSSGSRRIARA